VAALGKLIAYSALPGKIHEYAPEILVHFIEHGKYVEETIKAFLSTVRQFVKHDYMIIFHTLLKRYEQVLELYNYKKKKN